MKRAVRSFRRAFACAALLALVAKPACASPDITATATPVPVSPSAAWLLVSDVHFNPFDDPGLVGALVRAPAEQWHAVFMSGTSERSGYFADTNFALLESALAQMRAVAAPQVVAIAGDFLAHDFPSAFARAAPGRTQAEYERFVDKTLGFLAREFDGAFPQAQFVIALGNNDGYCGDYRSTPRSAFLAHMAQAWESLVNRNGSAPAFVRDFSNNGYYASMLPGTPRGEAIVLNSVVWSAKYRNACGDAAIDPGSEELDWLQTTMATKPASYRWIVSHIPPGIDAYSSLRAGTAVPFMRETYATRLVERADASEAGVSLFLMGHVHHASFYIVGPGDGGGVPGLVVPSISAIQGNNPAFLTAEVGSDGTVQRMSAYAEQGSAWQREPLAGTLGGDDSFSTANLDALQRLLSSDTPLRTAYAAFYNGQSQVAAVVPATWPWYWCADVQLTAAAYGNCLAVALPRENPVRSGPAGLPHAASGE